MLRPRGGGVPTGKAAAACGPPPRTRRAPRGPPHASRFAIAGHGLPASSGLASRCHADGRKPWTPIRLRRHRGFVSVSRARHRGKEPARAAPPRDDESVAVAAARTASWQVPAPWALACLRPRGRRHARPLPAPRSRSDRARRSGRRSPASQSGWSDSARTVPGRLCSAHVWHARHRSKGAPAERAAVRWLRSPLPSPPRGPQASERAPAPGALARLRDPDAAGMPTRRRRLRLRALLRARAGRRPAPPEARAPPRAYAQRPRSPVGPPARRHAAGGGARQTHSSTSSRGLSGVRSSRSPWLGWGGEAGACGVGRIRATRGWISVDRGSKATLPLTMPRRVFKSSAKDSARRPSGIALQGGRPRPLCRGGCACDASPWGPRAPTADREANGGLGPRFTSLDSDLEAFSHNPAHGSFAPLAFQPSAMTNCVNQRFLSY